MKVGINGFGRIGRIILRIMMKKENIEVVAVNDHSKQPEYASYLFKHDSIHGLYKGTVNYDDKNLIIDGKKVKIVNFSDPKEIPWKELGVEYVIDSTGKFKSNEALSAHIEAGAKKVILTAPGDSDVPMFVYGVNEKSYKKSMKVISCASCTTTCLAPLAKIIDENFGIEEALMTTIHSTTATQLVVDGTSKKDYRGGRAASYNIIPSSTGAAKAVGKVIPSLNGKLTGMSFRVPTLDVSAVDLTCRLKKEASYEDIVKVMKKAEKTKYKDIVEVTDDLVVSSDFIGNDHALIFDVKAGISLSPRFVKLVAWYDNEWGYSANVVRMLEYIAK